MKNQDDKELDLQLAWKELAEKKFNSKFEKQDIMNAIKIESTSSIAKLKKGLWYKILWSIGIGLALMVYMLFNLDNQEYSMLLAIAVGVYLFGSLAMYLAYRKIDLDILDTNDMLHSMKYNSKQIKNVLKVEMAWGLLTVVPFMVLAMLLGNLKGGVSISESLNDSYFLKKTVIFLVISVPIIFWLTNKMNKKALTDKLGKLDENIVRMETLS